MKPSKSHWIYPDPIELPSDFVTACNDDDLIAQLVWRRGIQTAAAARQYLDPTLYTPASHWDLPDMDAGVDCIQNAITTQKQICVWGDFDVDGQTSTALLVSVLRDLGANVSYYIPNRKRESHGIKIESLERQINAGAQVILTCDTGISELDAIAFARSVGVDVVVTDHHTLPPTLSNANANINPQRLADGHPAKTLPGVGAAYLFAKALAERCENPNIVDQHLDLVALGIVADVAEQVLDCRYWLQRGLATLRKTQRIGLHALLANADLNVSQLSATDIGFGIAPRLNALGRLADANLAVELLTTSDTVNAKIWADQIEQLNRQRKHITEQIYTSAQRMIEKSPQVLEHNVLVLANETWESGVAGLVAGRLAGEYQRPTLMLIKGADGISRGSARSVAGCNITEAIRACESSVIGFGGHPMAAGVSLYTSELPYFIQKLSYAAAQQPEFDQTEVHQVHIDAVVPLEDITLELYERLERLAPFGAGNPAIQLASTNVNIESQRFMGRDQQHRRLTLTDATDANVTAVWWRSKDKELPEGQFDVAYSLNLNTFKGDTNLQLQWKAFVETARNIETEDSATLQVEDLRHTQVEFAAFSSANTLIWTEGASPFKGQGRHDLKAVRHLLIASIPPSLAVLQKALETCQPTRVTAAPQPVNAITPKAYLQRLAGLAKTVVEKFEGEIEATKLASLMNSEIRTVETGLTLLEHQGLFTARFEGTTANIRLGATRQFRSDTAQVQAMLADALKEEAAFRRFFMQAELASLFG